MEEYTLYLDESKNKSKTKFSIAGVIVKNSNIPILDSDILETKKCIWDEKYINDTHPILHCCELTTIKNNRNSEKTFPQLISKYSHYSIFEQAPKESIKIAYDNVYTKLSKTLKDTNCTIIGVLIDIKKLIFLYGNSIKSKEELLFEVAMQEIIENYAHFLYNHNAVGNIIYESRNGDNDITSKSNDYKMFNNFCKIKVCNKGISFVEEEIVHKTVKYLTTCSKQQDISGLQLADFVVYNIIQIDNIYSNHYNNEFTNKIISRLYNGTFSTEVKDLRFYFGLKLIPFDFQRMLTIEEQNKKLRNSVQSLKKDNKNLLKKNMLLSQKKESLLKENEQLKSIDKQF